MTFDISKAKPDDAEDLCAVQMASIERLARNDYSAEEINAWVGNIDLAHALDTMQNDDTEVFVARDENGLIVGFSAIKDNQVTDMYVDPDHINEDIGTALLRKTEWHIRKSGAKHAYLLSTLNSVGFYTGRGYHKRGKCPFAVNDEIKLEMIEMRKTLKTN